MGQLSRKKRERRLAGADRSGSKRDVSFRAQASVKACGCGAAIGAWQYRCRYCEMSATVKMPQPKPAVINRSREEVNALLPPGMMVMAAMAARRG